MELWIRSQDRKNLIKINALYTDIPSDFGQEGFGVYCDKRDNYVSNTLLKIGQYKTKERALEVLDDIEDKLINCTFAKKQNGLGEVLDFMPNSIYVYEMPIK